MKHDTAKRITAVIMCLATAFAFWGCHGENSDSSVAGVEYHHFNSEDFYSDCDSLEKLASTDNGDEILSLYDSLYSDYEGLSSLSSVISIRYYEDVTDEYNSREKIYTSNALSECGDRFCKACRAVAEGESSGEFREHVGKDAFEYFADYDIMSSEEKKLSRRENRLVNRYFKIMNSSEKMTVEYNGRDWTLDELTGDSGEVLAANDYRGYSGTYNRLLKRINAKAGKIYVELVEIRNRIAELNGYDSYADYADAEIYVRDYGSDDIEALHEDVQGLAEKYYSILYNSAVRGETLSYPDMSDKELLANLQKYSGKISRKAKAAADRLSEEKLYSIGDDDCRMDGAFTTYIENSDSPFIFMTTDDTMDFAVMTHEFGHFTEYNTEDIGSSVVGFSNLDLSEIASNGYEGLMTHYYDRIFEDEAAEATAYVVKDLMENVIDGCIMDQFQRRVYNNPDITLEEINEIYSDVIQQYSSYSEDSPGYEWVFVNHNFESPMYYISYTVSGLASLEIWSRSLTDFAGACETWERIINMGSLNRQYLEVIEEVGLTEFTEQGAVRKICRPALKALR